MLEETQAGPVAQEYSPSYSGADTDEQAQDLPGQLSENLAPN